MVDRSYLQSAAARNYQDRKMAKWMGFFLSEHQAALAQKGPDIASLPRPSRSDLYLWASQALSQGVSLLVTYQGPKASDPQMTFTGQVSDLTSEALTLKALNRQDYRYIPLDQVIQLQVDPAGADWADED